MAEQLIEKKNYDDRKSYRMLKNQMEKKKKELFYFKQLLNILYDS